MLSRSFISAVSLLRASESRVLVAPIRRLHGMNGRAIRPASFVLSRLMSSQESSSTKENAASRTKKPPMPSKAHPATEERTNRRRRVSILNVISWTFNLFEILPALLVLVLCQWAVKKLKEPQCDINTVIAISEIIDVLDVNGKSRDKNVAANGEEVDSEK